MIRIGIDPGVRECGVAIETSDAWPRYGIGRIVRSAFIVRSSAPTLHERAIHMAHTVTHGRMHELVEISVCVEGQQVYPSERSKGDPNDMIKVAIVAGAMLGALATHAVVVASALPLPRQWKGNTPKAIHHERLARDFPHWVEPVAADTPKSLQHHVWDAVGLLEWHKERTT